MGAAPIHVALVSAMVWTLTAGLLPGSFWVLRFCRENPWRCACPSTQGWGGAVCWNAAISTWMAGLRPLQFAEKGRRGKDNSPRGRYLKEFSWDSWCSPAGSQSYPTYCEYLHCKVRQEEFQSLRPAGLTHHFLSHHLQKWLKVYLPWPFLINLRDNFPHLLFPQFAAQGPHGYLPKEKTDPCLCANQTETKRERCLKQATCKLRGKQNKTKLFATLEIICTDNRTDSSSLCRHQSRAPPGLLTLHCTWAHGNRLHVHEAILNNLPN